MTSPDAARAYAVERERHADTPHWPCVTSEVGRLRCVLLHRPGAELQAVSAAAPGRLLFDARIDVEEAQAEHDAFAEALRARGVEVLYLRELLVEAMADHTATESVLDVALPNVGQRLRKRLLDLGSERLADALIGRALLDPLPNLLFMRDQSVWIGQGVAIARMATRARSREADLIAAVYRAHPRFAAVPVWTNLPSAPAVFEGGDVLCLGGGRVVIGISERTGAHAARRLAATLLTTEAASEIVTVRMPPGAGFHLDLVLTVVDHDAVAVWKPAARALQAHRWRSRTGGIVASALPSIRDAFDRGTRLIEIAHRTLPVHGRRWDYGVNVLALAPGQVVAYADNLEANEALATAGVDVVTVDGSVLGRGRGGPRCLSCPVRRDLT